MPGVDLVASCTGDYEPEGLWSGSRGRSYGIWETSHDYILTFGPAVIWSQIAESPARFINAQWAFDGLDRAPAEFLVPWPGYPHGCWRRAWLQGKHTHFSGIFSRTSSR